MKRFSFLVLFGLLLWAGLPAAAPAQPFRTGYADNAAFYNVTPNVGDEWLGLAKSDGATFIRINVYWDTIAPAIRPEGFDPANPADPAYDWTLLDQSIKSTRANGMTPMLMAFLAPAWAEGPNRHPAARLGTWRPDPVQFAHFGEALARRYNGAFPDPARPGAKLPKVKYLQAWNEPNLSLYLNPQSVDGRLTSPEIFRRLQNRFYSTVKSVSPDVHVLAGGMAPIGRPFDVVIPPLKFLRKLTCMNRNERLIPSCSSFIRADIWDTHPFTSGGPTHEGPGIDDVSLGDLPELRTTLNQADRLNRIKGSNRQTALWATEFSWDTKPPDPGGLPMPLAKRWVAEALYRMWQSGVTVMTWLSIVDAPDATAEIPWGAGAQSGFYFRTDNPEFAKPKGSLRAFRFPFVAFKTERGIRYWGRTPNSSRGRVLVDQRTGGEWRRIAAVKASKGGIFRRSIRTNRRSGEVRARYRESVSVPFSLKRTRDKFFRPFGG